MRFGKSTLASEELQDVKDRIRQNVSVGYAIHHMTIEDAKDGGLPTARVDDWEPLEISIVGIPADATVGVGRDGENGN